MESAEMHPKLRAQLQRDSQNNEIRLEVVASVLSNPLLSVNADKYHTIKIKTRPWIAVITQLHVATALRAAYDDDEPYEREK